MPEPTLTIQYGTLVNVEGPARRFGDVSFVPAQIKLNGSEFVADFKLKDFIEVYPADIKTIVKPEENAPWVLGRLLRLFQIRRIPEEERIEKSCFFASFVAVLHNDGVVGIHFECSDYYGSSSIYFSTDGDPPREIKEKVANAFWTLLLENPTDVVDYEDKMYHSGADIWIHFGVENGESFMVEEPED